MVRTRTEHDKDFALVRALKEFPGQAIVYASTRRAVERVTGVLEKAKIRAYAYHAGLDDDHRHMVQDAFMREDVRAIVATNAFGMGIDKANVRLVIHHAMPGTLEAYYQEAGARDATDSRPRACSCTPSRTASRTSSSSRAPIPTGRRWAKVYAGLVKAADDAGIARVSAADLAAGTRGKVKDREAESALRILADAGAVIAESASALRVTVRLLASPERIRAELGPGHEAELELLRALWRAAGSRLEQGAVIDPDGLPPGFGGSIGVPTLLEALQSRQFLVWERTGGGLRLADPRAPLAAFQDRLGRDRPPPQGGDRQARRRAALRLHRPLPARLHHALLRRPRSRATRAPAATTASARIARMPTRSSSACRHGSRGARARRKGERPKRAIRASDPVG